MHVVQTDQRRYERKTLALEFTAHDPNTSGTARYRSLNVSAGGAFLVTDVLLEVGATLLLDFGFADTALHHTAATVVWVRRFPTGTEVAGVGLRFDGLSEAERATVDARLRAFD